MVRGSLASPTSPGGGKIIGIGESGPLSGLGREYQAVLSSDGYICLAIHREGLPIALLEAHGAGLPVVASSVGGIPQVIKSGGAGVLINSSLPSIWAEAFTQLLNDPGRMKVLGECARRHIQSNFSVDQTAGRYVVLDESMSVS